MSENTEKIPENNFVSKTVIWARLKDLYQQQKGIRELDDSVWRIQFRI